MRNHIRREAGQYMDAAWWLVPVAFAAAALAAVAFTDLQAGEDDVPVAVQAATAPAPAAPQPASTMPPAQAAEPVFEVTEHVQAF